MCVKKQPLAFGIPTQKQQWIKTDALPINDDPAGPPRADCHSEVTWPSATWLKQFASKNQRNLAKQRAHDQELSWYYLSSKSKLWKKHCTSVFSTLTLVNHKGSQAKKKVLIENWFNFTFDGQQTCQPDVTITKLKSFWLAADDCSASPSATPRRRQNSAQESYDLRQEHQHHNLVTVPLSLYPQTRCQSFATDSLTLLLLLVRLGWHAVPSTCNVKFTSCQPKPKVMPCLSSDSYLFCRTCGGLQLDLQMMLPWLILRSWGRGHWCNHSMAEPWCEPTRKIKFPETMSWP